VVSADDGGRGTVWASMTQGFRSAWYAKDVDNSQRAKAFLLRLLNHCSALHGAIGSWRLGNRLHII
jgi:hypothetical protein